MLLLGAEWLGVLRARAKAKAEQAAGAAGAQALAPVDQEWARLMERSRARAPVAHAGGDTAAALKAKEAQRAFFTQLADGFQAFRFAHPDYSRNAEARLLEAKALLKAARAGDEAHRERAALLIDAIRRDTSIPEASRCELVGMSKYEDVQLVRLGEGAQRRAGGPP